MVISILNNKGGVGKTTSAIVISDILAKAGYSTLIVDLDPQRNITEVYYGEGDGIDDENLFCKVLDAEVIVDKCIKSTEYENISIIPSSADYADLIYAVHDSMEEDPGNALIFKKNISFVQDYFDYVIIDNSPFHSTLTTCSICCSDGILTPIQTDNYSYSGLVDLIGNIADINEKYDLDVKFLGIFMTRVSARTNIFKGLSESYLEQFESKFIPVSISQSNCLNEMNTEFVPLLAGNKNSKPVREYIELLNYLNLIDNEHYKTLMKFIKAPKRKPRKSR